VRTGADQDTVFHLFLDEDKAYNNAIRGVRIQELDIGIAIRLGEVPVAFDEPYVYYSSWTIR